MPGLVALGEKVFKNVIYCIFYHFLKVAVTLTFCKGHETLHHRSALSETTLVPILVSAASIVFEKTSEISKSISFS